MALKRRAYTLPSAASEALLGAMKPRRVGGSRRCAQKDWAWARLEPPSVQILVVVANTPARPWRTDVEKGFV